MIEAPSPAQSELLRAIKTGDGADAGRASSQQLAPDYIRIEGLGPQAYDLPDTLKPLLQDGQDAALRPGLLHLLGEWLFYRDAEPQRLFAQDDPVGPLHIMSMGFLERAMRRITAEAVTARELALAAQIAAGLSLREAAERDGVGHETKRSQYRSLAAKLDVTGQTQMALVLGSALAAERANPSRAGHGQDLQAFRDYVDAYVPGFVRSVVLMGADGRLHRYLDMGPEDGTPMIVFHTFFLPALRRGDEAVLERHKLRLIWPVRAGYLEPDAALPRHVDEFAALDAEAACVFHSSILRRPFVAAFMDMAAFAAPRIAQSLGADMRALVLGSPPIVMKGRNSPAEKLRQGMREFALSTALVAQTVFKALIHRYRDPAFVKDFLMRSHGACAADAVVIEAEYSGANPGARIRDMVSTSGAGAISDVRRRHSVGPAPLAQLPGPLALLTGADDPIDTPGAMRARFAEHRACEMLVLPDCGKFLYFDQFEPAVAAMAGFARKHLTTQD